MSNSITRIGLIILVIIAGVTVVLAGWFYFGGVIPETEGTTTEEPYATGTLLLWAAILFGVTALVTLVFSLYYIVTRPKALKNFIILIVAALVLVGIAYVFSSGESLGNDKISTGTLIRVDVGLISTYILFVLALLGIIFTEVYKVIKG